MRTNIVGTFELLEATRELLGEHPDLRDRFRFLHVSTDEVFGSLGPTGAFEETTPYDPSSPYSASKASADHLVRAFGRTYDLPVLVTNCSNNYGPYQFPEKLIPLMVLNAIEGKDLPIYGDGSNVRDWLHVDDHCRVASCACSRRRSGDRATTSAATANAPTSRSSTLCVRCSRKRCPTIPALGARDLKGYSDLKKFVTDRPGHDQRYAIDAGRIEKDLGWRPSYAFEDGLRDTIRWYLENRRLVRGRAGRQFP